MALIIQKWELDRKGILDTPHQRRDMRSLQWQVSIKKEISCCLWPCSLAVPVLAWWVMVLWFYAQEHPKAKPAVVLVLKRLRGRDKGLKVSSNRLGEAGNGTCDPWFTRHRFIPYTMEAYWRKLTLSLLEPCLQKGRGDCISVFWFLKKWTLWVFKKTISMWQSSWFLRHFVWWIRFFLIIWRRV